MSLRLTKQQREYQEEVLAIHGLTFNPSSNLVEQLAGRVGILEDEATKLRSELNKTAVALEAERNKSLWVRVREAFTK